MKHHKKPVSTPKKHYGPAIPIAPAYPKTPVAAAHHHKKHTYPKRTASEPHYPVHPSIVQSHTTSCPRLPGKPAYECAGNITTPKTMTMRVLPSLMARGIDPR